MSAVFTENGFRAGEASCVTEVESQQATTNGSELACSQVVVVETDNGHVTRWQSCLSYPLLEKQASASSSRRTERPGDTASCPASNYRETKSVVTAGSWPIRANRRTTGASITESAGGSPRRSAGTTGPGRGRRIVQHSLTGGRSPKAAVRNGFSDRLADRQQGARSRVAERRGEQGSIGGPWLRYRLPESGEETGVAYEPAQSVSPSPWLGSNSPPQ